MTTPGKRSAILAVAAGVITLILIYFGVMDQYGKRHDWTTGFKASSNQPYGTKFIRNLLETYRPGSKFTYNDKKPLHLLLDSVKKDQPTDYIFIGQSMYLGKEDDEALRNAEF